MINGSNRILWMILRSI